jgi:hypothetical protein
MSNYANSGTTTPLAPWEPRQVTTPISHSSEQGKLSTSSLISGQPFHTEHVVAHVVLRCLLQRLGVTPRVMETLMKVINK